MKEASGELNMTLVTIIAIAAIAGLIYWLLPTIKTTINERWGRETSCTSWDANGNCTSRR